MTNTRGVPLADIVIELATKEGAPPLALTPEPTSDDRGRFRVHGFPPGPYTICATPRSERRPAIPGESVYARTCFPFAVALRGTSKLALQLERLGAFSIRGTVLGSEGTLPPRLLARLVRLGDGPARSTVLPIGTDGAFAVGRLPPGAYEVTAQTVSLSRPPSSDPSEWARVRIEIVDRDVTDVVVQLTGGVTVRGRVFIDDPNTDRGLRSIEVRAVPPLLAGGVPSAPAVETDDDGLFALKGLFGPTVVRVRTPDRYAVKSIRYAGRDITDVPVEFANDPDVSVEIVLSPATAEIAGRVLDDVGRPAEDAGVLYFPADPAAGRRTEGGLRQQSIGGRYRIDKIPGGDYLVIAVRGPRPGWTEKDYAALAPLAERITLGDGERRVLDLRAVTLGR